MKKYKTHSEIDNAIVTIFILCLAICMLIILIWVIPIKSEELRYNCTTASGIAAMLNDGLEEATIKAICDAVD